MLYAIIDLSRYVAPGRAVAELEGMNFKRSEQRLKRFARSGAIAEAVHNGPLRVYKASFVASQGEAHLIDRHWMTQADFPWTSYMDSEVLLIQHTTYLTHRVSVVCESGLEGHGVDSVRIEWDFASGKKHAKEDHSERVEWAMDRLGVPKGVGMSLALKRLLRLKPRSTDAAQDVAADGKGDEVCAEIRGEDGGGSGSPGYLPKAEIGGPEGPDGPESPEGPEASERSFGSFGSESDPCF